MSEKDVEITTTDETTETAPKKRGRPAGKGPSKKHVRMLIYSEENAKEEFPEYADLAKAYADLKNTFLIPKITVDLSSIASASVYTPKNHIVIDCNNNAFLHLVYPDGMDEEAEDIAEKLEKMIKPSTAMKLM